MINKEVSSNSTNNVKPQIYTGGDFEKLVTRSDIFLDRSLFVKEIFESANENTLITAPRRWGKSINLDMLRKFLAIEVDENGNNIDGNETSSYKIFFGNQKNLKPLKISDQTLKVISKDKSYVIKNAKDVHGKYPVIYIDFKGTKGSNYQNVRLSLKKTIISLYESFSYLGISKKDYGINIKVADKYKELLKQVRDFDLNDSIKNLTVLLHKHHEERVWILIDEYDAAINNAFLSFENNKEAIEVIKLFRGILETALKLNSNLYKGVITGVYRIAKANLFSGLNDFKEYNFTDLAISKYYGISGEEIKNLFDFFDVKERDQKLLKDWYNGYTVKGERSSKYNVWSVVNSLNDYSLEGASLRSYWTGSGNIDSLKKIFKKPQVMEKIEKLIKGEDVKILFKEQLSSDDLSDLRDMIVKGNEPTSGGVNLFLSYLMHSGYFTITDKFDSEARMMPIQIPNKEIKLNFADYLAKYFEQKYGITDGSLSELSDILREIFIDITNSQNIDLFKSEYGKLLKTIGVEKFTESAAHNILFTILCVIKNAAIIGSDFKFGSKGRPDIALKFTDIKGNKLGVIIELKYKKDTECALQQIKDKEYVEGFKEEKMRNEESEKNNSSSKIKIIGIGINISDDLDVDMKVEDLGEISNQIDPNTN